MSTQGTLFRFAKDALRDNNIRHLPEEISTERHEHLQYIHNFVPNITSRR
jgi:hypothetical protein